MTMLITAGGLPMVGPDGALVTTVAPEVIKVSNAAGLMTELGLATGGERIKLAAGDYGAIDIKGATAVTFSTDVTSVSADRSNPAIIRELDLRDSSHLVFDGINFVVVGATLIKPFWIQLWAMGLPLPTPPPQSGLLWGLNLDKPVASSPIVTDDTLYVGSGKKLVAVDLQSHQKLWEFEAEGVIRSSPALVGTTIYVGSENGRLYAVDATTGEKLWDVLTGGKITSSPAVADGTVYISSHDGNLYAIE